MKNRLLLASLLAAVSGYAEESDDFPVSFSASADIESAYICRGYVWDTRPYSAQDAGMEADLGAFGSIAASVWSYSPMSSSGHSDAMSRRAYAEVDYLVRYYYDIDLAEGWRLRPVATLPTAA